MISAVDVQDLTEKDLELLDLFFSNVPEGLLLSSSFVNETAVIRTQVSSCFGTPAGESPSGSSPKARRPLPIQADSIAKCGMKGYKTVSEMIRAGFCVDRHGHMSEIPKGTRIGIPDDDIPLTPAEYNLMLDSVDPENLRDHLFLGMSFRTGARESQDTHILIDDVDFVLGRVFVQAAKEGISFYRVLDADFLAELAEYVKAYHLRKGDYLFCIHYDGRGHAYTENKPISRKTGEEIFYKYAEKAGIQYRYVDVHTGELRNRIHPHTAKYTFCSIGYDKEPSMLKVALTVGNKTIYPLMQNYIKVPTWQRHKVAEEVISELTCRHHNALVKLIHPHQEEMEEIEQ